MPQPTNIPQKNIAAPQRAVNADVAVKNGISMPAVSVLLNTEVMQLKVAGEEELLQKKPFQFATSPLQQQAADDEEPSQKKPFQLTTSSSQRLEPNQEEPLQKKPFQLAKTGTPAPTNTRPNQTGMPDNLKAGVEALSGIAMDDVKVHYNSDKPAQLQALAYAQGTDIHIAPGQERHLPHEAWHVVQQKQGRVQPTIQLKGGVAVNDDKGLESEADVMGEKAIQRVGNNDIVANSLNLTNNLHLKQNQVVQRLLIVDSKDYTNSPDGVNDTTVQNLLKELIVEEPKLKDVYDKAQIQLSKWMLDKKFMPDKKSPSKFGSKTQIRKYESKKHLALALLSWINQKEGRRDEKVLSEFVKHDSVIANDLTIIIKGIYVKLQGNEKWTKIRAELKESTERKLGTYSSYFNQHSLIGATKVPNLLASIENPADLSFVQKVVVIHDMMEYLQKGTHWKETEGTGIVENRNHKGLTYSTETGDLAVDESRGVRKTRISDKLIVNVIDEDNSAVKFARNRKIPMWGGFSYTNARLMDLAKWAEMSKQKMTSLTLAISAFWRTEYDHTTPYPYHTLHETAEVARNYGVDYKAENRYAFLLDINEELLNDVSKHVERRLSYVQDINQNEYLKNSLLECRNRLVILHSIIARVKKNRNMPIKFVIWLTDKIRKEVLTIKSMMPPVSKL